MSTEIWQNIHAYRFRHVKRSQFQRAYATREIISYITIHLSAITPKLGTVGVFVYLAIGSTKLRQTIFIELNRIVMDTKDIACPVQCLRTP